MRRRLETLGIDGGEGSEMVEDAGKLSGEALDIGLGESDAREPGYVEDFIGGQGHWFSVKGTGNWEQGAGNGERGTGNGELRAVSGGLTGGFSGGTVFGTVISTIDWGIGILDSRVRTAGRVR